MEVAWTKNLLSGMKVRDEFPIKVYYAGQLIGEYFADIVVNDLVIL